MRLNMYRLIQVSVGVACRESEFKQGSLSLKDLIPISIDFKPNLSKKDVDTIVCYIF
jgi:hypothetical protein